MALVKLKDVVMRVKDKVDRDTADLDFYIGGEHFDYAEICISRRGVIQGSTIGPAFHMRFQPGDVLLMSRNPHLRKAGVVDFEGICSDVSYVCRTKDENVLLQRYLPFIFQTDHFWDFAESNKKGSTNFFLNWSDFEKYEFNLPPIEIQRELTELLWAAENTKLAYVDLLRQTDELVKSQFIEMFGDPIENPNGLTSNLLSDVSEIMSGITKGRKVKTDKLTHVPYICTANVQNGYLDWTETKYIDATDDEIEKYSLESDDLLMIEGGDPDKVGRGYLAGPLPENCIYQNHVFRVRIDKTKVYPEFLAAYILLPSIKDYFLSCAKQTTGIATINKKQLSNMPVMYPDLDAQMRYIEVVRQSDKSKFELKQAIERVTNLMKSLMQQDFAN